MKYVILIHSNQESRAMWEDFPPEEQAAGLRYYASITEDLMTSSELIVTEALADPSTATQVTVTAGKTITTDGPFAEAKEHLAGFYLVDCESKERAVEIAARIPEAELGLVEVRPVMSLNEFGVAGFEM